MLEDNYINDSQNVQLKIKITDYMKLSKEDRQKHIDLSTPCQFHYFEKDWGSKKKDELYSKTKQKAQAKKELLKLLKIEEFGGNKIHVCHLCDCSSTSDKICINPAHLYFGTVSENYHDKPLEVRQKVSKLGGKIGGKKAAVNMTKEQLSERASKSGKIGGKKAGQLGKTGFQQKAICPYCGKEGQLVGMKPWHFDNCKNKQV